MITTKDIQRVESKYADAIGVRKPSTTLHLTKEEITALVDDMLFDYNQPIETVEIESRTDGSKYDIKQSNNNLHNVGTAFALALSRLSNAQRSWEVTYDMTVGNDAHFILTRFGQGYWYLEIGRQGILQFDLSEKLLTIYL